MRLTSRSPLIDGFAQELGVFPTEVGAPAVQAITGASFTNNQSFGSGTITADYDITGAPFTNTQSFGAGALTTNYEIIGTSFTNSQSFGNSTISLAGTTQNITGASFTNTQIFGDNVVSLVSIPHPEQFAAPSDGNSRKKTSPPIEKEDNKPFYSIKISAPNTTEEKPVESPVSQKVDNFNVLIQKANLHIKNPRIEKIEKGLERYAQSELAKEYVKDFLAKTRLKTLALRSDLNEAKLDAINQDRTAIANELSQKEEELRDLDRRIQLVEEQRRRRSLETEEEELALMYLMLN